MNGFPIGLTDPPVFAPDLPRQADVVVIGGGVIGVMTAYHLAGLGSKVVLCEKGRIAAEQSSRNWGWIRQQGRDFSELPIMIESLRIWQDLSAELGPELGFSQQGVLYLARSEAEMEGFQAWTDQARGFGVDTAMRSRQAVQELIPDHRAPWIGGLFTGSDARAEPWRAVPVLARAAQRRGAVIIENCAVRALDRAGGCVVGVITENGRIACDQVVVAGGAWSSLLLRREGVALPQLSVLASVAATVPLPEVFAGNAADDLFAFRRRMDGGYTLALGANHDFFIGPDAFRAFAKFLPLLRKDFRSTRFLPRSSADYPDGWGTKRRWSGDEISPFERQRVLNPKPNLKDLRKAAQYFAAAFPQIGVPPLRTTWAGMIDTLPDLVPVVDRIAAIPGLVVATGMSGYGFGIGPGMGRVVADLVRGRTIGHDLTRFRHSRFSDGSPIRLGPRL
jgi:glycine/D-amino acid oxidase-like deaminating enzyme